MLGALLSWMDLLQTYASIIVCDWLRVEEIRKHPFLKVIVVRTSFSDWRSLGVLYIGCQSASRFKIGVEIRLRVGLDCFWTLLRLGSLVHTALRIGGRHWILLPSLEPTQLAQLKLRTFLNTPLAGQSFTWLCPHRLTLTETSTLERLFLFFELEVANLARVRLSRGGLDWLSSSSEIWKFVDQLECIQMVKWHRMLKRCKRIRLLKIILWPTQCLEVLLIFKYFIGFHLSHSLVVLLIKMQIL